MLGFMISLQLSDCITIITSYLLYEKFVFALIPLNTISKQSYNLAALVLSGISLMVTHLKSPITLAFHLRHGCFPYSLIPLNLYYSCLKISKVRVLEFKGKEEFFGQALMTISCISVVLDSCLKSFYFFLLYNAFGSQLYLILLVLVQLFLSLVETLFNERFLLL